MTDRTNRRVSNLLRQTKLRQQACIEDIDYHHHAGFSKKPVFLPSYLQLHPASSKCLLTGSTGLWKKLAGLRHSHQACRQGMRVRYWRVPRLLEELRIAHADGSYRSLLLHLVRVIC